MTNNILDRNIIKSVLKSFLVLETLTEHENISVGELSEVTKLGKSTTHRILNTLKYLRYVDQDPKTNNYFATIKMFELGNKVANKIPIRKIARPHMENLFAQSNETINLGILDNQSIVYLDKIVAKEPLRIELDIGIKVPAYCSALGKVLTAYNNNPIQQFDYVKYTENTINSDEDFQKELEKVRNQGYAVDNEEYIKGLYCIAVPVLNTTNDAIASISISMPAARFSIDLIDYYIKILKECTLNIEKNLFYWNNI